MQFENKNYLKEKKESMVEKKRRKDSYFGMHFDFHANAREKGIGTKTTAENIGKILDAAKPDYIQVDTKGHAGWASYFSDYAPVAPGLEVDHLKIIREETEKRGIALYAHHTGIFNRYACKHHHEWAVMGIDGEYDIHDTDLMSSYTDKELIPCLEELAGKYGFDGAWVDGEVWAVKPSFRQEELEAFYKESGFDKVDSDKTSELYNAYVDFWRRKFREYLAHYMGEVHKVYPNFDITSNFAFSQQMPEKPIDEIDFLSGDTAGLDGRLCVRCYAGLDKPWDAMSYGFGGNYMTEDPSVIPLTTRHIDRIQRDASITLSQGGGYQFLNNMTQKGEMRLYDLERMKQISEFVYARKPFNFRSNPMKNPAVLVSAYNCEKVFMENCDWPPIYGPGSEGVCNPILDGGLPCDVIYDFALENPQRNTIIIPDETKYMNDEIKQNLKKFTENGGNLIVCGRNSCKLLSDMVQADVADYDGYAVYADVDGSMYGSHNAVVFEKHGAEDLIECYTEMKIDAEKVSAIVTNPYGKGRVVFIGYDIMDEYRKNKYFEAVEIMHRVLDFVEPEPNAYLESGIKRVEVVPATKDGKILVNIINTTEFAYDEAGKAAGEIVPIYDITVAVKCNKKPTKIMLEPENTAAEYTYDGKYAHVKVDKLHVHRIITIE